MTWWRDSENEWENALLLFGAYVFFQRWGSGSSLDTHGVAKRFGLEPSLPQGMRLPGTGELREVTAVRTPLDPAGLPNLYNVAVQIALDTSTLAEWLHATDMVELQPRVPQPDSDYAAAGALFASHSAVETDNGRAVWNYNTGNVTTNRGDYYRVSAAERKLPGQPTLAFQSFNFPLQGAIEHVARVQRLWPAGFSAAMPGDVHRYAEALQGGRPQYATGVTPAAMESAMRARAAQLGVTDLIQ